MASSAQITANRTNASNSTGPATESGKLRSSRNSLKHGLASRTLIIPGENPADFEALHQSFASDHQPATAAESSAIREMAISYWLKDRAIRLQAEAWNLIMPHLDRLAAPPGLGVLIRYQTANQNSFYKSLTTLLTLKKERPPREIGFVSQNATEPPIGFVSQPAPPAPTPPIGFVSQNGAEPSAPSVGFISQNASATENGFVSQKPSESPSQPIGFVSQNRTTPRKPFNPKPYDRTKPDDTAWFLQISATLDHYRNPIGRPRKFKIVQAPLWQKTLAA
jgi:hypothetical protein